ncbi:MAG: hypothetical protein HUK28_07725, partial [Methanobrevibacter sp.]|nr:hypothetical protein [Methanobrevibacter sp.]
MTPMGNDVNDPFYDNDSSNTLNLNMNNKEKNECKLRPNLLLAIHYAPDLFSYENVIKVIENVEKYLLRAEIDNNTTNILGIKTLDKTDNEYNGILDMKDTSNFYSS